MGADVSDLSLVRRVQRGDKGAFESLLEPVIGMGARLAHAMLLDRTWA